MSALCSFALAVGLWLGADPTPQQVEAELAAFEGTWSLASGVIDGKPMSEADVKRYKRTYKGERWTFTQDGRIILEGTVKVDPTAHPKTIDLKFVDPNNQKEGKLVGIYELEGDEATHCLAGEARPVELRSEPGSGNILFVWRRDK